MPRIRRRVRPGKLTRRRIRYQNRYTGRVQLYNPLRPTGVFKVCLRQTIPTGNVQYNSGSYCTVGTLGASNTTTFVAGKYGIGAPGTDACFALYFKLSDIHNYLEYTNLFDQYRLDMLEVFLYPNGPTGTGVYSTSTQSSQSPGTVVAHIVDYDDANPPTNMNTLTEYGACKITNINDSTSRPIVRKWKPHLAVATYQGAFTAYKNEPAGWIDSAYPDVQHFGMKFGFASPISLNQATHQFSIFVKYHLSFKNVR